METKPVQFKNLSREESYGFDRKTLDYIRNAAAHDIAARVAYRGDRLRDAVEDVILGEVPQHGGDGGAIAVDTEGNVSLVLNTRGMYRGWVRPDGARGTAIYQDA